MSGVIGTINYAERGRVNVVEDADALARAATVLFIECINQAVSKFGIASVALSGGSTPKQMGALLAQEEHSARIPWSKVHIFWGDERWVPLESSESNAGEAKRTFLDKVGIPEENVHPFETRHLTPEESAWKYEALVRAIVGSNGGIPVFDLIFLGMGDDGHTASLFPGTTAINETQRLVVANHVPKLDTTRLTMTAPLLNAGRTIAFLAAGAGKAARLHDVLDGPIDVNELPSQIIRPAGGPLWLVDRAAIAKLSQQLG
jgi:6-phosphogluconolactonase